jgi:hypothetical protein
MMNLSNQSPGIRKKVFPEQPGAIMQFYYYPVKLIIK